MIRLASLLLVCATPALCQDVSDVIPAQSFTLDPAHSSVVFTVDHLGFSRFTAGFDQIAATLDFDPENPTVAVLRAEITTASLDLPTPPPGFLDTLLSAEWFDAATHPTITFVSDRIVLTGERTADIEGTLTLRGISAPVTLQAMYNGGWGEQPFEPAARIGFSAEGSFSRTAFGMGFGVPAEGSTLGVGDLVRIRIEAEWSGEPFR